MPVKFFYPLVIVILGFIVYSNAFFTNFILDDKKQIVEFSYMHSPLYIPLFLVSSVKINDTERGVLNLYYKPLFYSFLSLFYIMGHGSPFPFHLFQISLHAINAILLYYLFKRFIPQNLSFLLAVIFLVHPANELTVAYIASLQDVLFFFFGMVALLTVAYQKFSEINRLRLVSLLLLLSLLSKETGILFLGITFLYTVFFEKKLLARAVIFFVFLLAIYFVLRIVSSNIQLLGLVGNKIIQMSLWERIVLIPNLLLYYLKEILIPSETVMVGSELPANVPVIHKIIFLTGIVALGFLIFILFKFFRKSHLFYPALLFFIWFITGIGAHLQIYPLDVMMAKRWLYFPLAGFLGFWGLVIVKLNMRWKKINYLLFPLLLLLIGFFAIQTHRMNILFEV